MTACTRSRRPSFISTRPTWVFTVVSETTNSPAISAFERPRAEQAEGLPLALGQRGQSRRSADRPSAGDGQERLDHPAGDRGRQQRLSAVHRLDGVDELLGLDVLEQEAAGAGAQRVVDVLVHVERRQHDHPGAGVPGSPRIRRVASMPSMPGIRTSIRTTSGVERAAQRDRLVAVCGLAHDLEVGLDLEDHPEPGAHQGLVVGDEDADRHGGSQRAGWPAARSRRRGGGRATSGPPYTATRSRMPQQAVAGRGSRVAPHRRRRGRTGRGSRAPSPIVHLRAGRCRRVLAACWSAPPGRSGRPSGRGPGGRAPARPRRAPSTGRPASPELRRPAGRAPTRPGGGREVRRPRRPAAARRPSVASRPAPRARPTRRSPARAARPPGRASSAGVRRRPAPS